MLEKTLAAINMVNKFTANFRKTLECTCQFDFHHQSCCSVGSNHSESWDEIAKQIGLLSASMPTTGSRRNGSTYVANCMTRFKTCAIPEHPDLIAESMNSKPHLDFPYPLQLFFATLVNTALHPPLPSEHLDHSQHIHRFSDCLRSIVGLDRAALSARIG